MENVPFRAVNINDEIMKRHDITNDNSTEVSFEKFPWRKKKEQQKKRP